MGKMIQIYKHTVERCNMLRSNGSLARSFARGRAHGDINPPAFLLLRGSVLSILGVLVKKWITSILVAITRKTITWMRPVGYQSEPARITRMHLQMHIEPGSLGTISWNLDVHATAVLNGATTNKRSNRWRMQSKCCPEVDQQWLNQIWEIQVFLGKWSTHGFSILYQAQNWPDRLNCLRVLAQKLISEKLGPELQHLNYNFDVYSQKLDHIKPKLGTPDLYKISIYYFLGTQTIYKNNHWGALGHQCWQVPGPPEAPGYFGRGNPHQLVGLKGKSPEKNDGFSPLNVGNSWKFWKNVGNPHQLIWGYTQNVGKPPGKRKFMEIHPLEVGGVAKLTVKLKGTLLYMVRWIQWRWGEGLQDLPARHLLCQHE